MSQPEERVVQCDDPPVDPGTLPYRLYALAYHLLEQHLVLSEDEFDRRFLEVFPHATEPTKLLEGRPSSNWLGWVKAVLTDLNLIRYVLCGERWAMVFRPSIRRVQGDGLANLSNSYRLTSLIMLSVEQ